MVSSMKYICALGFLAILAFADGAGECGGSSPDIEAVKLFPCASAAKDEHDPVSTSCCNQVQNLAQKNPWCLCAVMLSNTFKISGVDPAVAMTIPKRCNMLNRPVGEKCGSYALA